MMLSVTKRLESVSQPNGGYVPVKLFAEKQYDDGMKVVDVGAAFAPSQGMVVDYLTRLMITNDKLAAFDISLAGAKKVDLVMGKDTEYKKALSLLQNIGGLDDRSIYNACKIVGYDAALRRGVKAFKSIDFIKPSNDLISNIRILVKRSIFFLNDVGPIESSNITFPGGYTGLVSSGDGDYMTVDMLIDFKVSKKPLSPQWSLQLLMYYLLGINSSDEKFKAIKSLCIYNPLLNKSYIAHIDSISDKAKYTVSHEILGYKMKFEPMHYDRVNHQEYYDYSTWAQTDGTDTLILGRFLGENLPKGFDVNGYPDGIHKISIDDYWSFLKVTDEQYVSRLRPKYSRVEQIFLIKKAGYVMFSAVSPKGIRYVLHGAKVRKTQHSLEYFYANMERYVGEVLHRFSGYWEALNRIAGKLKELKPDENTLKRENYAKHIEKRQFYGLTPLPYEEWYELEGKNIRLSGRVHGCIIDIDYMDHLYINPYDGTITPYFAMSMYDKDVYQNTISLIAANRPEMLEAFKGIAENNSLPSTLHGNIESL